MTLRQLFDNGGPCPDSGPSLLARIEQLIDPREMRRIRLAWLGQRIQ